MKHGTRPVPGEGAPVDSSDPNCVGAWVSVEDGLPEMHEYVLVFPSRGIGARTETFDENYEEYLPGVWHWECDGEGFKIDRVTHWARIRGPGEWNQKPDVEA